MRLHSTIPFIAILLLGVNSWTSAQETPPLPERPKAISSSVTIGGEEEPGERLVVSGTFYRSDRKTPVAGILLYIYQADAGGVYNKTDGSWQRPRLNGWFRTDEEGRYTIRTVKPGSYPQSRQSAHIHLVIVPENGRGRWLDDFLFEGDPYLSERDQQRPTREGKFSNVMTIRKGQDGSLSCERDIVLDTR